MGYIHIVKKLLMRGANVNYQDEVGIMHSTARDIVYFVCLHIWFLHIGVEITEFRAAFFICCFSLEYCAVFL